MDAIDHSGRCVAGRYRLRERIAAGPHATVWRATDELLHRDVAVKVLDPSVTWLSWAREARAAAAVRHENVVAVYDAGDSDVGPFVVMELIEGETLAARLARRPLAEHEARRIGDALLAGLAAVHDRGLVHRDVKPGNIMLTDRGRVVLMDFGTARAAASETTEAAVVGTPGYIAPERAAGAPGSPAADVFAAALVLEDLQPAPPAPVAALLATATADDPTGRPPDACALRRLLAVARGEDDDSRGTAIVGATIGDRRTAVMPRGANAPRPRRPRRRRRGLAAVALATLAVAGVAATRLAPNEPASPGPPTTVRPPAGTKARTTASLMVTKPSSTPPSHATTTSTYPTTAAPRAPQRPAKRDGEPPRKGKRRGAGDEVNFGDDG